MQKKSLQNLHNTSKELLKAIKKFNIHAEDCCQAKDELLSNSKELYLMILDIEEDLDKRLH